MNPLKFYKSQTPYYGINLRTEALPASVTLKLSFLYVVEIYLNIPRVLQKFFLNIFLLKPQYSAWCRDYGIGIIKDESGWGYDCWFQLYLGTNYAGDGWSFSKSLTELIYGELSYNREVEGILKTEVLIPGFGGYLDGTYELKINRVIVSHTWKRFNKKVVTSYYEVECEEGVPHRRKYGNQDRRYSLSSAVSSPHKAIECFIESIQQARLKDLNQS